LQLCSLFDFCLLSFCLGHASPLNWKNIYSFQIAF
jgi:hypothetical protein